MQHNNWQFDAIAISHQLLKCLKLSLRKMHSYRSCILQHIVLQQETKCKHCLHWYAQICRSLLRSTSYMCRQHTLPNAPSPIGGPKRKSSKGITFTATGGNQLRLCTGFSKGPAKSHSILCLSHNDDSGIAQAKAEQAYSACVASLHGSAIIQLISLITRMKPLFTAVSYIQVD